MSKKESFLQGILYLMLSQVIVKILGMIYSLYLTNKQGFGDSGNGICMSAYQIYALFLGICSIGVPNAISRMVAENAGLGDGKICKKILKISLLVFSGISLLFCFILYFGSDFIATNLLSMKESSDILKILAPSIVFATIEAVFRGYFNGREKIIISAKIQVLEQVFKTIITIILVELISQQTFFDTEVMAKGSMLAASLATAISFIYSLKEYIKLEKKYPLIHKNCDFNQISMIKILKEIFVVSIPISITAVLMILENNIDSVTIVRLLKNRIGETLAREKYGIITSKVNLLVSLPMALNGAIAIALIPEISKSIALSNYNDLEKNIHFSFLITLLISIPVMLVFVVYSRDIISFLYPNANKGGELLTLGAITIVFTSLTQTMAGILQGMGDSKIHLIAISIAMLLKLILNFVFIPIEGLLEKGALLSSAICDFLIFMIMYTKLRKTLPIQLKLIKDFCRISFISIISIFLSKIICKRLMITFTVRFLLEFSIISICYCILCLKCNIISIESVYKHLNINKKEKKI